MSQGTSHILKPILRRIAALVESPVGAALAIILSLMAIAFSGIPYISEMAGGAIALALFAVLIVFVVITLFMAVVVLPWQLAGVLWAPLAAMIAAKRAKRRTLSVRRHAIMGFTCSILYLIPWIYLLRRMRGRCVTEDTVEEHSGALHIFWALFVTAHSYATVAFIPSPTPLWFRSGMVVFLVANGTTLWLSFENRIRLEAVMVSVRESLFGDTIPHRTLLTPLVFLSIWCPLYAAFLIASRTLYSVCYAMCT